MEGLEHKKAKTHKGRKHLDALKPKLVEGPKKTLFIKGNKTSEFVTKAMQDLYMIKKEHSIFLNERWEIKPFDTVGKLEDLCNRKDCGLFVFGMNSKKRPNALYFGRIYDQKLLDLVEFEVTSFSPMDVRANIIPNERPFLIFQGDLFEYEANFMRIKNLIGDIFVENVHPKVINIKEGIRHFIAVTAVTENDKNKLIITQYELLAKPTEVINADTDLKSIAKDIGPSIELVFRRSNFANDEQFKKACKQPKPKKDAKEKNITTNTLGEHRGRVYMERQNLDNLALKKRRKQLSKSKKREEGDENGEAAQNNDNAIDEE